MNTCQRHKELQSAEAGSLSNSRVTENFFHWDANNIGDQVCGPANYFPRLRCVKRNLSAAKPRAVSFIVGGGLVFDQMAELTDPRNASPAEASKVCWGVGIPPRGKRDHFVEDVAARFDLFGTRNHDWSDRFDFVPCVSCMANEFDSVPAPSTDVVVFAHQRKTPALAPDSEVPFMSNIARPFGEVLRFIASGETVVTSSYHGVYWAQLLGRKVVCIPFNNKFKTYQFQPHFATPTTWRRELGLATQTAPLLEHYRDLNLKFYQKVMDLWELD